MNVSTDVAKYAKKSMTNDISKITKQIDEIKILMERKVELDILANQVLINVINNESLKKYDFNLSKNNHYCTALISTLFDVTLGIPINYYLSKNTCERSALRHQFKYLNKSDILIMDRGYYSIKLL